MMTHIMHWEKKWVKKGCGVTEVATWNDNGSSYTSEGDKGIIILACLDDVDADSTDSVYVRYQ